MSNYLHRNKKQEIHQSISIPKTLELARQNMIPILVIVLTRNCISIELRIQELDQQGQHTKNSRFSWSEHGLYLDHVSITKQHCP